MARSKALDVGKRPSEKPELFLASSGESVELAHQLQLVLSHNFTARPWTAGVIRPSKTPLQSLEQGLKSAQYAVFLFAKDDRTTSRGKAYDAVRDNVLLELGMFIGKLGSERCFVVAPKDRGKLKIPSDLDGFTLITYDDALFGRQPETAVGPVAVQILNAARGLGSPTTGAAGGMSPAEAETLPVIPIGLPEAVTDLLELVSRGEAGVRVTAKDKGALKRWSGTVLKNALHVLKAGGTPIPDDAYVAWLCPVGKGPRRKLGVFAAENLPAGYNHYEFAPNEGLAGTVWFTGQLAVHTKTKHHPAWKIRPGCDNAGYICVPVGPPSGAGGVLSFGSDRGFRPTPAHESVLKVFGGLLAVAVAR